MTTPNTLIFVDMPSNDPAAAGKFYAEVFGWRNDARPEGVYHRIDRKSTRLNSSHIQKSRMPSSA